MLLKVDERRRDVAALRLIGYLARARSSAASSLEAALVARARQRAGRRRRLAASYFVNWHYQAVYRTPLRFSIVTGDIVLARRRALARARHRAGLARRAPARAHAAARALRTLMRCSHARVRIARRHRARTAARDPWRRRLRSDAARHGDALDRHARVVPRACCSRTASSCGSRPRARSPSIPTRRSRTRQPRRAAARASGGRRGQPGARRSAPLSDRMGTSSPRRARRRSGGAGRLRAGRRATIRSRADEIVANDAFAARHRARSSATRCDAAAGYDPQLRTLSGSSACCVSSGACGFIYLAARPARVGAAASRTLQAMSGPASRGPRLALHGASSAPDADVERERDARSSSGFRSVTVDLHARGAQAGRRAAQLLPPARRHPRRGEPGRRLSARHHARDRLGERAHRRDLRDARASACRALARRRSRSCSRASAIMLVACAARPRPRPRDRALAQRDPRRAFPGCP